jgi:hypothetical protein
MRLAEKTNGALWSKLIIGLQPIFTFDTCTVKDEEWLHPTVTVRVNAGFCSACVSSLLRCTETGTCVRLS